MEKEKLNDREETALDALMGAALRQPEEVQPTEKEIREFLRASKPPTADGKAAIKKLRSDVIKRLVVGNAVATQREREVNASDVVYAAMNRKNTTSQHDAATEAELKRKRQGILDKLKKQGKGRK
jgi:hypothetical protein